MSTPNAQAAVQKISSEDSKSHEVIAEHVVGQIRPYLLRAGFPEEVAQPLQDIVSEEFNDISIVGSIALLRKLARALVSALTQNYDVSRWHHKSRLHPRHFWYLLQL